MLWNNSIFLFQIVHRCLVILRAVIITVCIVIIPVSMSIYENSRREKYAGKDLYISVQKCSPDKNTVYYEMSCTMWKSNRGSVIKNDPQHFDAEFYVSIYG